MTRGGKDTPTPASGAKRYFYLLGAHFGKLIRLNLLFLLCAAPVLTLPASLCALNRVLVLLIRNGNCFVWADFIEEFKRSFKQSLPLGLLFGAGLFAGYYLLSLGISNDLSLYGMIFFAVGLFILSLTLLRACWTFVLLAMQKLPNKSLLGNARVLMARERGRSALIFAGVAAFIAFSLLLFPLSIPVLLLILFSLLQYSICFLVNTAVQTQIFDPYEKQLQEEKTHVET